MPKSEHRQPPPIRVYAHCGFELTQIDGTLWRTRLRADSQGNPPVGWPQVVVGFIKRTSEREASFTGQLRARGPA